MRSAPCLSAPACFLKRELSFEKAVAEARYLESNGKSCKIMVALEVWTKAVHFEPSELDVSWQLFPRA